MLYVLGVLIFVFGLLASIALHEIGHMVPAKKFGVKVTQYMVGFGPTLWSAKRGETEYGVKWLPLGGYIRMIGMVPPRADGKVSRWPRRMATAVEDFRQHSRAEVGPGDEDRQFYRLTPGKKMIVMVGGPTMNFVIYLVLTVALLTFIGQKQETTTLSTVSECVVKASVAAQLQSDECTPGLPKTPVFNKLYPGDQIVAIDGTPVRDWDQVVNFIEPATGKTLVLTIRRDGVERPVEVVPVENEKFADDEGKTTKMAGFLGVSPTWDYQALPVTEVPGEIVDQFAAGLRALASYPEKMAELFGVVFTGEERDPAGAIGVVGMGRIGGEIAATDRLEQLDKFVLLVALLAGMNLLLFLFNLLPLLPLDGGHIAGAVVEAVRRGKRRLRGKGGRHAQEEDHYVDTAAMLPVMYGVASLLIALTLLVVYADIVKPVTLGL